MPFFSWIFFSLVFLPWRTVSILVQLYMCVVIFDLLLYGQWCLSFWVFFLFTLWSFPKHLKFCIFCLNIISIYDWVRGAQKPALDLVAWWRPKGNTHNNLRFTYRCRVSPRVCLRNTLRYRLTSGRRSMSCWQTKPKSALASINSWSFRRPSLLRTRWRLPRSKRLPIP